jgi:hypothetical protein
MNEFLNQALTPIVNYVCNQTRSIPYLFSTIEYTPLKKVCIRQTSQKRLSVLCGIYRVIKEYC